VVAWRARVALAKVEAIERRHKRVRKKIVGTPERPRLNVYRSNKHIYAQVIDDMRGTTLVGASDLEIKGDSKKLTKTAQAREVGKILAKKALAKKIDGVVFDRGGRLYHGRVKALAEGAREAGLHF
jgi:large subunit ribosomal protein L18